MATVGFGIGTGDLSISLGAFYLFMTNLVAIALSATLTAGFYGFRPRLMERPSPWRGMAVLAVFVLLSIPLVISLRAIGLESRATAETRTAVADIFAGADSRITLLDARSEGKGVTVSTLVSTKKLVADAQAQLQDRLSAALHTPVTATLDQIVVADPQAAARSVQASTSAAPDPTTTLRTRLSDAVPFASDAVMTDAEGRRAIVLLRPDSGLDLASAYALEAALRDRFEGVDVWVTPPVQELASVALGDAAARARAVWALARWRASPAVRFCRPAPGLDEAPDAAQAFRAQLAAAGVSIREEEGPACLRGDENLARLDLG